MEIQKVELSKSLTLSEKKINEIAKRIIKRKINWIYVYDKNFWLITISPDGKIIEPDRATGGHPELADAIIYPNDELLQLLYDYFYPKDPYNEVEKSAFMIFYGYINIDGYIDTREVTCKYNLKALTNKTRELPNSMSHYSEMADTSSADYSDEYQIELSDKVPFFKRKITAKIKEKYPDADINKEIKRMSKKAKRQLLNDIEDMYVTKNKDRQK